VPPDLPVPTAAVLALATGTIVVTFSSALQAGVISAGNWSGVAFDGAKTNERNTLAPVTVAGSSVTYGSVNGALVAGPDRISYAAAPADLLDSHGRPIAAFADFPLTVI